MARGYVDSLIMARNETLLFTSGSLRAVAGLLTGTLSAKPELTYDHHTNLYQARTVGSYRSKLKSITVL